MLVEPINAYWISSGLGLYFAAEEVKWTDLCAVCDGVGLLGVEVRQSVCRFPLTGVVNSWTSCKEKPYQTGQASKTL